MPLHLLHHKSYHVYSTANIERVRRDEAAARAKEEAEEQRMQEEDAENRIRILRARAQGADTPVHIGDKEELSVLSTAGRSIAPEDTSQIGKNENSITKQSAPPPQSKPRKDPLALTGADGHINLFGDLENPKRAKKSEKNAEHEAERKAKEEKLEAQYTMGLGKPAEELKPWYSTLDMVGEVKGRKKTDREVRKDERSKDWRDPLVAIKRGVRGVKAAEEAREEWKRIKELEVGDPVGLATLESERIRGSRKRRDRSLESHNDGGKRRGRSPSKTGHRNHSNRHRERHYVSSSRSSRNHRNPPNDLMDKLRRERDEREKVEREKAEAMLNKEKEYRLPGWEAAGGGRYSSQFGIGEVRKR